MPQEDPNFPTLPILSLLLFAGIAESAIGVIALPMVAHQIAMGECYSFAVVIHVTSKIHRATSPISFWVHIGFLIFGGVMGIILGPLTLVGNISAYIRKIARQRREDRAIGRH